MSVDRQWVNRKGTDEAAVQDTTLYLARYKEEMAGEKPSCLINLILEEKPDLWHCSTILPKPKAVCGVSSLGLSSVL